MWPARSMTEAMMRDHTATKSERGFTTWLF